MDDRDIQWFRNHVLTWQTKSGEKIAIEDMEDLHLMNTIKMLERKAFDGFYEDEPVAVTEDMGDMASYYAEQEPTHSKLKLHSSICGIITNFRKLEQKIIVEYVNYVKSVEF